jgi:hypothetical protein
MSAEQDLANANVRIVNLISEVTRFRGAADGKYFSVHGGDGPKLGYASKTKPATPI